LSVNNDDISTSILSIREIVGIIIIFSLVLYLVFPKDNIDEILEGKGTNTNLSINYLESMLLYYPDSVKLKMILIRNYERAGENKKALALAKKLLLEVNEPKILKELYKIEYLLTKDLYFKSKDKTLLPIIKEKLYNYFGYVYNESRDIDYMFFFGESTQMDFPDLKYLTLIRLMKQKPELADYTFTKQAFVLALALGENEDAYIHLLNLLKFDEIERELKVYAVTPLLEHGEYKRASAISISLFLSAENDEEMMLFFKIALNSILQNENSTTSDLRELFSLYVSSRELKSYDIQMIINILLQIEDVEGASLFAISLFQSNKEIFDEIAIESAINSLVYSQKLASAMKISLYAYREFDDIKWLDKSIQFALWQGKMYEVVRLNTEGYRKNGDLKYEKYLLKHTTLNTGYEILGEIYRKKLEKGDYDMVKKVAEYFNYIGAVTQGEQYFLKFFSQNPNKQEIHKEAIKFSYANSHFKKGLQLYSSYKEKYGINKELHQKSITKLIALKKFKKAYEFTKELDRVTQKHDKKLEALLSKLDLHDEFQLEKKMTDLAWIHQDYKFIYNMLWEKERTGKLASSDYWKLIALEKSFKKGRLAYLYEKIWRESGDNSFLYTLLSLYMEQKKFKRFKSLINRLNSQQKRILEKNINYNMLLANYHIQTKDRKKAKKRFEKALRIDRKKPSTHQAYLWFLIDNRLSHSLKKEIIFLRKRPKLQSQVGFASVVGSLMLQKTDLALRWLKPLLKSSNNIEYQVVYGDILQLQDREEGASRVRLKLFKQLNRMIKKSPELLKEKAFARIYLRMVVFYKTPYEKKAIYFKRFKSLFKEEEFREIEIGWYAYRQSTAKAKYIASKYHIDIPWLNLYLAMNRDNERLKQNLLEKDRSILAFRDRVIASIDIGDRAGAYTLAFKGLEDNSRDTDLYKIFDGMINADYPTSKLSTKYKHLSPHISLRETHLSHRWRLYKGLKSELSFRRSKYHQNINSDLTDDTLAISLQNSDEKFSWDVTIAKHMADEEFISSKVELEYQTSELSFGIKANYQERAKETPKLQVQAVENSIEINLKKFLTKRVQLSFLHQISKYKTEDMNLIGSSSHTQLGANYLLHAGYPDIRFATYLSHSDYESEDEYNLLPRDFFEFGTQLSIGRSGEHRIQRSWRPFGTVALSLNDREDIGTSLSLGLSGSLNGEDSLSLYLDYSKGIDMISTPSYGFHLDYRF
jgi:hypothetical protein